MEIGKLLSANVRLDVPVSDRMAVSLAVKNRAMPAWVAPNNWAAFDIAVARETPDVEAATRQDGVRARELAG